MANKFSGEGLAKYCENILANYPTIYMWGGLMRSVTADYIDRLASQYPARYSYERRKLLTNNIAKRYGCDCVGLIKSYYFGGVGSPDYNAKTDFNTTGFFSSATKKGTIDTLPEVRGIVLYMDGHVGVYVGNGEAIECTLGAYGDGVVKTKVKGRGWTHWLMISQLDYDDKKAVENEYIVYTVKSGDTLTKIARSVCKANTDISTFKMVKDIPNKNKIYVGDKILIPKGAIK